MEGQDVTTMSYVIQFWTEYWQTIVIPGIAWSGARLAILIDRRRRDRRLIEVAVTDGLVPQSVAEACREKAAARARFQLKSLLSGSDDCVEMSNIRAFADVHYRRCEIERELAVLRKREERLRSNF
jgi:hypothetical protein